MTTDTAVLLDPEAVAERLATSERHVRRLIGSGRLPAVKVGGKVRIRATDLDDFLAGLPCVRSSGPSTDRPEV